VGGTTIQPGDIVVLDVDGAVVVPAGQAKAVLNAASSLRDVERQRRARYQDGELSLDVMKLRQKLEGARAAGGTSEG
jgi:4-hydroxy-4-methyl-2-oxoglutarate aldolase